MRTPLKGQCEVSRGHCDDVTSKSPLPVEIVKPKIKCLVIFETKLINFTVLLS